MDNLFDNYQKKNKYLVCIDSDGCAIDSMDIKHYLCFGPCMVIEWKLDKWRDQILNRWNEVNLFKKTRGINRFKGLSKEAPFDKIIITACSSVLPTELLKQLSIGGKMVIPYQDKNQQIMLRITRVTEKDFSTENFGKCAFVPMLKGIEKK